MHILKKPANPFPKVTDLFCRLPLPTLFYQTRGFSPWRPDAVYSTNKLERQIEENIATFNYRFPFDFQGTF